MLNIHWPTKTFMLESYLVFKLRVSPATTHKFIFKFFFCNFRWCFGLWESSLHSFWICALFDWIKSLPCHSKKDCWSNYILCDTIHANNRRPSKYCIPVFFRGHLISAFDAILGFLFSQILELALTKLLYLRILRSYYFCGQRSNRKNCENMMAAKKTGIQ